MQMWRSWCLSCWHTLSMGHVCAKTSYLDHVCPQCECSQQDVRPFTLHISGSHTFFGHFPLWTSWDFPAPPAPVAPTKSWQITFQQHQITQQTRRENKSAVVQPSVQHIENVGPAPQFENNWWTSNLIMYVSWLWENTRVPHTCWENVQTSCQKSGRWFHKLNLSSCCKAFLSSCGSKWKH